MTIKTEELRVRSDEIQVDDHFVGYGTIDAVHIGEDTTSFTGKLLREYRYGSADDRFLFQFPNHLEWIVKREVEVPESVTIKSVLGSQLSLKESMHSDSVQIFLESVPGRTFKVQDILDALEELGKL
jgi:hypothetical protein